MLLTKLKATTVLVFVDEEFEKVCKAIQTVLRLDNFDDYVGSENANLLYDMEKNIMKQLGLKE